ncbi:MAG: type II toxin-antitoxin system RelE/ParE family toxin [Bacteroidales bacterium]
MEIVILWSEIAERQLKEIFQFYSEQANTNVARKIVTQLIDRVTILKNNPLAGQKEELLANSEVDFRYLVEGNYKIIYWKEENRVTIATVFDCRQNPIRMVVES